MKSVSPRPWIATALATAVIGLSATAIAQNTPPTAPVTPGTQAAPDAHRHGDHAEHHAQRMQHLQARMAEHQAQLKQNLKLTPAQEPAWNAFVARMQPQPRAAHTAGREGWKDLGTLQRLDRMEAMKAERDKAMAQRHDAIRSFYAQLTPEQQKTFDTQGMGHLQRAGMQRGHHGGHDHGHRFGGHRM